MRACFALMLLVAVSFLSQKSHAQQTVRKFDSTMKIGKAGYKVVCNNRSADKNTINISPIGFDNSMRDFSFEIKGRVRRAEVDDVNRDNFPDLVLYIYSGDSLNKGTVVCISSEANTSVLPIVFPDIADDPKLRDGYKGDDEFLLMEGILTRRFPLYATDNEGVSKPTGKTRQVMYRVAPGDKGGQKFIVMRTYDYVKQ
ncbi:hypothetical protein [Sediminibacterium goheungense]|uniref:PliI/PliC-like inhibitor of I-type lysozyme n=1 Tax=Sediminibacterium goheungense TaxID=1086393 RepID=A0A4R6J271_9BACT|nr:hypothetical protein [Sediminibacterium goheungense]TDO28987.1 hypothetical protein BC659_1069 [Sediminibacterium goheungense]